MENQISKVKCLLCSGEAQKWCKKNNYFLYRCKICHLIFVYPLPLVTTSIYDKNYFIGGQGDFGYVNYDRDKIPMISTFKKYIKLFNRYGKSSGKIFDVGAASGFFLNLCRDYGYEIFGSEISDYAIEMAQKKGILLYKGDFLDLNLPYNNYDIITLLDVLEHLKNPLEEILAVKKNLKKGGLLVINTPNSNSFLAKILRCRWHLISPPEHLFYFSPSNLSQFLKDKGFNILYINSIGKKFTLAYIFQILYRWQGFSIWKKFSDFFMRHDNYNLSIPINLYDNFFIIAEKNEE